MQNVFFFFFGIASLIACCELMDIGAMTYVEIWISGNSFFSDFEEITLETSVFHFVIVINVDLNCNF